jgi:hypothetical protein
MRLAKTLKAGPMTLAFGRDRTPASFRSSSHYCPRTGQNPGLLPKQQPLLSVYETERLPLGAPQ